MIACHRTGEALFPRYSHENDTFDEPSAVTWRFFTDIAMERAPTYEKLLEIVVSIPKDPPPTRWPKRANFVNRQKAGEAVLEGLRIWIRPNIDVQKHANLYLGHLFMI